MYQSRGFAFSLGVVIPMFYPGTASGEVPVAPILERVLQDPTVDTVELTWIKSPDEERRVKQMLDIAGVAVEYSGAFPYYSLGLDLASLDEAQRVQSVESLKPWMSQAYRLGAQSFLVLSGQDPGPALRTPAKAALADSVNRLCGYAEVLGCGGRPMSVVLEYSDREVDKRCLLGPTAEAAAFADLIRRDHPDFGLVVDQSHVRLLGENPLDIVSLIKGRTANAHIANAIVDPANPLHGDQHPPLGLPGSAIGVLEIAQFLAALRESGYFAVAPGARPANVSLELKSRPGDDPDVVLACAHRYLRRALLSLE